MMTMLTPSCVPLPLLLLLILQQQSTNAGIIAAEQHANKDRITVVCPEGKDGVCTVPNQEEKTKTKRKGLEDKYRYYDYDNKSHEERFGSDLGVPQGYGEIQYTELIQNRIKEARSYMKKVSEAENKDDEERVTKACRNKDQWCTYWAVTGACTGNPAFMETNCAPVCSTCHKVCQKDGDDCPTIPENEVPQQKEQEDGDDDDGTWPEEDIMGSDLGVTQTVGETKYADAVPQRIIESREYLKKGVAKGGPFTKLEKSCRNKNPLCAYWALTGKCDDNEEFMNLNCSPVCFTCSTIPENEVQRQEHDPTTDDHGDDDGTWPEEDIMGSDLGVTQKAGETKYLKAVPKRIIESRDYLKKVVAKGGPFTKLKKSCRNKDPLCAYWAVTGQCDDNEEFMDLNCAPVCFTCEQSHVETRCPLDPDAVDAFYPGDLGKMMERITTDPFYEQYHVTVVSRDPWMLQFDNMITPEEAQRLIEYGTTQGYERSSDVGKEQEDGTYDSFVNDGRTSTQSWCQDDCYEDPVVQRLMERMENITGIHETNAEYLQLLRYESDQFYHIHNDYIAHQKFRPCGVRILTFYIYLSDVEEGGETEFPGVGGGVLVKPKAGRAVLWPSVLDEDPNQMDRRTDHIALPVIKGVKYGANAWYHQRSFKEASDNYCI